MGSCHISSIQFPQILTSYITMVQRSEPENEHWHNSVKLRTTLISVFSTRVLLHFRTQSRVPQCLGGHVSCNLGPFLSLFLSFTTLILLRKSCSQLFCKMSLLLGLSDDGGPHRLCAGRLGEGRGTLGGLVGGGLDRQRWKEDPSCQDYGVQAQLTRSTLLCSSAFT